MPPVIAALAGAAATAGASALTKSQEHNRAKELSTINKTKPDSLIDFADQMTGRVENDQNLSLRNARRPVIFRNY